MAFKPVALLLADLGVAKTHSRPRIRSINPYSESQFKTLKYCPSFPGTFAPRLSLDQQAQQITRSTLKIKQINFPNEADRFRGTPAGCVSDRPR